MKDNNKQHRLDATYINMCKDLANLSYAKRAQVGCLIVSDDGQIISNGYNGTPSGFDNCCEDKHCTCKWHHGCQYTTKSVADMQMDFCVTAADGYPCDKLKLTTKYEVLHAESNAIAKCAKWGGRTEGSTLYVTLSPCFECAKLIIQAGIKRVVYKDEYRDITGLELLRKANIDVVKYGE